MAWPAILAPRVADDKRRCRNGIDAATLCVVAASHRPGESLMITRRAAIALLPVLALCACGQRDAPAVAVANGEAPAPAAPAATPTALPARAGPASAPTGILTCRAQIGAAAAAQKVATCRNVSPATHPPCNAANSCALIDDEIARSCALFDGKGAPMAGCTVDPKSAQAAAEVVRRYYDAIGARDYATAWAQWGENGRPGQTLDAFTRGFADTRAVRVTIGTPGRGDGTGTGNGAGPGRRAGGVLLGAFAALLVALPLAATALGSPGLAVVADFYRAGALVFGGGHVVLPLLQAVVVPAGWASNDAFLAGYGAAQAVPGPLFTFSAYLGAVMPAPFGGWAGGLALLVATFVPAFLLVAGALPYWESLRRREDVRRALAGVNAAVVGVLLAALYDPVWTGAIRSNADVALGLAAFGLLVVGRVSPVVVVALAALAGWAMGG